MRLCFEEEGKVGGSTSGRSSSVICPPEHTLILRSARELGFVWSKEGLEGYHAEEDVFSAFFSSDSGTTNARGEHLLPSTKVAFNLNAQGLHLSVAQFINWSKTAAITGMILQLWEKQKLCKKVIFARNCRIEPLLLTSELPKWVRVSGQPSQVLTLTLVQWDYLLAKLKSKQPFKRRALLAALIFISSFVMSFSQPLTGTA